jgi:hypothetical protein
VDFSGDGDMAGVGDDVGLSVIKVVDGDGETLDDEREPEPAAEPPEPEPEPEPEPVLPLLDVACEPAVAVGAVAELVYEAPLAE